MNVVDNGAASYTVYSDGTIKIAISEEVYEMARRVLLEKMGTIEGELFYPEEDV